MTADRLHETERNAHRERGKNMKLTAMRSHGNFSMKSWLIAAVLLLMCGGMACAADQPPYELSLDCGNGQALKLISIPAGEFMMGSPEKIPGMAWFERNLCVLNNDPQPASGEEQPQHKVRITKPFYLGKFPVTQAQYEALMGANPSR